MWSTNLLSRTVSRHDQATLTTCFLHVFKRGRRSELLIETTFNHPFRVIIIPSGSCLFVFRTKLNDLDKGGCVTVYAGACFYYSLFNIEIYLVVKSLFCNSSVGFIIYYFLNMYMLIKTFSLSLGIVSEDEKSGDGTLLKAGTNNLWSRLFLPNTFL